MINKQKGAAGTPASDFSLLDQNKNEVTLKGLLTAGPLLLVFYPGDFTMVCTKQLCNYRDHFDEFSKHQVQLVGISGNTPEEHERFSKYYSFTFPLLTDKKNLVAKEYGCTSLLMLGGISRAAFIVSKNGMILYRYVEPTVITRRKADELIEVVTQLDQKGLLK